MREAVVNALVHRDLRRAGRIAIRRFHDRLEVWSPGSLPEGLSDVSELLREGGVPHPRNPILAAFARSLGIGEQRPRPSGPGPHRWFVRAPRRSPQLAARRAGRDPPHWQRSPVGAC